MVKRRTKRKYVRKPRPVEPEVYVIGRRYQPGQQVKIIGSNQLLTIGGDGKLKV